MSASTAGAQERRLRSIPFASGNGPLAFNAELDIAGDTSSFRATSAGAASRRQALLRSFARSGRLQATGEAESVPSQRLLLEWPQRQNQVLSREIVRPLCQDFERPRPISGPFLMVETLSAPPHWLSVRVGVLSASPVALKRPLSCE